MSNKSIKKNYIFSLINKLFAVLVPILVTPHLARVLEPDGNGAISFIASIASYFVLFANLGIETYGQRVIAIHREEPAYIKKFFYEITILRSILTVACLLPYSFFFISKFNSSNNAIYAIFALSIFSVIFDFTWFFQGVEDFKILAVSNIITRLIYVVLVFVLVKSKSDLALASGLSVMNTVLPFFLSLPFFRKYLKGKLEEKIRPFSHFKECLVYFIPTVAVQIYTVLDKTMIGLITHSDFENGYYEQAEKLVKIPLTLVTTLFVIIRSRISYYYSQEEYGKISDLISKSANVAFGFSLPMMTGIIAVARTLVPIYLGEGYDKCILLLYVFSPIIPIISISNLIGTHYYTPFNKQKTSNLFLIAGAVINLILNSFLIYLLQSVGAAIASVSAEFAIAVLYIVFARKFINPKMFIKIGYKYLIASLIMFVPVFVMDYFLPETLWVLVLEIGAGIAVYFVLLLILKVDFVFYYLRIYKNKICSKFRKKTVVDDGGREEEIVTDGVKDVEGLQRKDEMCTKEEIICNFKVSSERRKVWEKELEMVKIFIDICEKHNLKYVASGGTLLGAVRHRGFIPWDDDIDLMMPRSDFEKFIEVAQAELSEKFFLQHYKTEKKYINGHAQIRSSETTCLISTSFADLKAGKNCGIFIDIFPYDEVPDDRKKRDKQAKKIKFLKKICFYRIYKSKSVKGFIKNIIQSVYFLFHSLQNTIEKIDVLSQKYNGQTDTVALVSFLPGYEKNVWKKEWFEETEKCKFEDIVINIPIKYDEVLRTEFGDYMQLPKDLNGVSIHGRCFFDTEKSYKNYTKYTNKDLLDLIDKFSL